MSKDSSFAYVESLQARIAELEAEAGRFRAGAWDDYKRGRNDAIERCAQVAKDFIDGLTDSKSATMSHWDEIRHLVETHKGSDLPRLAFESLIETVAEQTEAAIRALKDKP